ncbi:MAG: ATP-dependent carboxylate-amine ligase, partial [Acidimicrobiia bacterium]
MAPAGDAQPLLMQLAEPMTTRADDVAPDIDLLGLVERFVPGLGARRAQPVLLLLADPRVPDAALLERELTGRGVPYLRLGT